MSERVIVIGAGVGGLAASLALGRAGHQVTLLEHDQLPPTADNEATFDAERRGAPQVHQTHGFLARIQVVLRDRFPDVFADLLAAGGMVMPARAALGEPQPGDEDLQVLIIRRTTLEWVLRTAVAAQPEVAMRTGVTVTGLVADRDEADGPPVVTGIRLDDGTELAADLVVAATGRRGPVGDWLGAIGVELDETVVESGLMYLTRWYRRPAAELPPDPKLGGDLGFVKFLAVPGDGDTLSVTLAVRTRDKDLRKALSDPDTFDVACALLPGPDLFFQDGPMEPIGGVRPMAGLINRLRRFTADEGPTVLGFHAIGDAHTCTNPLYGRGCSLAVVQATLLADAVAEHPGDPVGRALALEAASVREIEPWYHSSVEMDRMGADPAGIGRDTDSDTDGEPGPRSEQAKAMGAVFAAAATDPVIGRSISRLMNMLMTPAELMADGPFLARMAQVMANPDDYPPPPQEGPTRRELLDALTGATAGTTQPADVPTPDPTPEPSPDPTPDPAGAPA